MVALIARANRGAPKRTRERARRTGSEICEREKLHTSKFTEHDLRSQIFVLTFASDVIGRIFIVYLHERERRENFPKIFSISTYFLHLSRDPPDTWLGVELRKKIFRIFHRIRAHIRSDSTGRQIGREKFRRSGARNFGYLCSPGAAICANKIGRRDGLSHFWAGRNFDRDFRKIAGNGRIARSESWTKLRKTGATPNRRAIWLRVQPRNTLEKLLRALTASNAKKFRARRAHASVRAVRLSSYLKMFTPVDMVQ